MNCRQTRSLVSAYSDQELTGRQMLEISEHLRGCPQCAREWQEINEVRRMLRAAFFHNFHNPPPGAQQRLMDRVLLPDEPAWSVLFSALTGPGLGKGQPPRGRRLATALALSSLAVLIVAGPFAPQTRDAAAVNGQTVATLPPMSASMFSWPTASWGLGAQPKVRMVVAPSAPSSPPSAAEGMTSDDPGPLRDAAMADYVQSNAAWASVNADTAGPR